ncbi:MAG: gatA [Chitinophagaceae bacterium]|nr:gatA [Chitinophagaceae bacterium]
MRKILFLVILFAAKDLFAQQQDTVYKTDIPYAARIMDLQFSQPEIDSMYSGVLDNYREIRDMHKLHLENSVPMSLWQMPVAPPKVQTQKAINWKLPVVQLPANRNDLAYYSIAQLASLIKSKKISSVELTQFFINRLKKFSDSLQCVISFTEDIAMQQARHADSLLAKGKYLGLLHGIPYGLKDLFAVKGTKTTWGAQPYREQVIDEDAFVYTQLKNAGAVLIAKFTLGALAMGDYWYGGRTKNPWNLQAGSSGSSAGSASATSAGLVPFAIGTETWGSIISPATTCGVTGLRPTFGSISRSNAMTLSWSLDKVGPLTRSAEDAAIVFNYIHGTDGKDLSAVNMPFNYDRATPVKKLRIAYAQNYFNRLDTSRPEWKVLDAFKQMGVDLIPVNFPDSGIYKANIMDIIIGGEGAAAFDEFTRSNLDDQMTRQTKNDWPNNFRTSRFISAADYINANRHRYLLMKDVDAVVSQYDAIICPTWSGSQSAITNLTGHPAICVPIGLGRRGNQPQSITFIGHLYGEAELIAAAKAYQDVTGWDEMHPPMFK